ncbi:Smg7 [Thalictrum thalictroides]|uniref:Smg7 n=1 Tax=Thalictrum thalictroides TaxID=46969 RepID=A0A7J6UUI2_THATH|nr:Smg7 [Thalictrum thalictroides]
MPCQNQQPIISGASSWLVDQQTHLVNGVNNLNIVGNGFVSNTELKDGFGSSQPPAHSLPFPKSFNHAADSLLPNQILGPEAMIPSKLDSIMSLGSNADSMTLNASAALQASLRKNPVSRPVRHLGPPPGFSTVPLKHLDDVVVGPVFKDENPPVDDYSWLDGYQLSSSAKGMTPNNNINNTARMYPHVMNENSCLTGAINFPFPGKQVPSMQSIDDAWMIRFSSALGSVKNLFLVIVLQPGAYRD